jgi:Ca2+/Na+ antiporter
MSTLTQWALAHPWPSRILTIMLEMAFALAAVCLGVLLYSLDIRLPAGGGYAGLGFFFVGTLLLLLRHSFTFLTHHETSRRRIMGGVLLSAFILICGGVNQQVQIVSTGSVLVEYRAVPMVLRGKQSARELHRQDRRERRELRREPRRERREWRAKLQSVAEDMRDERSKGMKILLTILVLLAAAVLAFVLGYFSLVVSFEVSESLAISMFLVGFSAIVWGVAVLIRRIFRGKRKRRRRQLPTT